jgi:hypothetical protein
MKQYARMLPAVNQIEVNILICIEVPTTNVYKLSYTHGADSKN